VIIECPHCESRVDAKVLAEKEYGPNDGADPYKISFLELRWTPEAGQPGMLY
jgi:hypothetical protein